MTGSFDRDVTPCKVEAPSGLLEEVGVAEDDNVELKSDRFE